MIVTFSQQNFLPPGCHSVICLSPPEGFSKSGQCTRPILWMFKLTQESLTPLNLTPVHRNPLFLHCFSIAPTPVFPSRTLSPTLAFQMLLLPGDSSSLLPLSLQYGFPPWQLLSTNPCAWALDTIACFSGSVILPKSCCLPAPFLQREGNGSPGTWSFLTADCFLDSRDTWEHGS